MKVYFVRHGESVQTEARHQSPDTPLSSRGLIQARAIAQRIAHLPVERMLTSTCVRALQTTSEIEKATSLPLIKSDLLVERKMPTVFYGKLIDDPEIVPIHEQLREHFFESTWRYADEENYPDILARVKKALALILSQQKEHIVVVTHGYFLSVLVFHLLFGESADQRGIRPFQGHVELTNTGLTVCAYKDERWRLLTWNDYTHLGE